MVVVGLVGGGVVLALTVQDFTEVQARVEAGETARLDVQPGQEYLLWGQPGDLPSCTVTEPGTSDPIPDQALFNTEYTRGTWEGMATIEPATSRIEIACDSRYGPLEIGEKPSIAGFAGGLVAGIAMLGILGGGGIVLLIVIGILYATGAPRGEGRSTVG